MFKEILKWSKWNVFFSNHTNDSIDKSYQKMIELSVEKSNTDINDLQKLHKLDNSIQSWEYTAKYNRERQRLSRYPIFIILTSSLVTAIVATLLTIFLTT